MNTEKSRLESLIEDLKRQRDELRVQMHLARNEAKEEWEKMEKKWETVEARLAALGKEAAEGSKQARQALGIVTDEIAAAYRRIRDRLS